MNAQKLWFEAPSDIQIIRQAAQEDVMDEYYTLTFFGYPDAGKYIIEDLQQFMCPEHYYAIDDARLVAEYWMRYGFFRAVRCDKRVDGAYNLTKYGVFYAQKLDGKIAWVEQTGETVYTETTHAVVWKFESTQACEFAE